MKEEFIQLIADTYTEPELDDILAFYRTPSGASMLAKSEIMMQKGAAIGEKRAATLQPRIQPLMLEFAQKMQEVNWQNPPRPLPAK
jgi:hypothetical protein